MLIHINCLATLVRRIGLSKQQLFLQTIGPELSLLALGLPVISSLAFLLSVNLPRIKRHFSGSGAPRQDNKDGSNTPGLLPTASDPKNEPQFESVSEQEWNSYTEHTRKVALLTWNTKEKVPAGFLSKPNYAKEFTYVEEILARNSKLEGSTVATSQGNIFLKGILVSQDKARKADYTVEDPLNPGTALYLDEDGYRKLSNSCISARKAINVLFHPLSDKTKFPPLKPLDISKWWIRDQKHSLSPFIIEDVGGWMNFIHPSIATRRQLEKAVPASSTANPLGPKTKIQKAVPYIVRCMSNLQSILALHKIPSNLQWGIVSIVLTFHSMWYYSSLQHSAKFFKECKRLLQKYLAGTPELISQDGLIVSIDKTGLPRIIPLFLRLRIRTGNVLAIAVTFFALDVPRMYVYVGADKLTTITDAPSIEPKLIDTLTAAFPLVFDSIQDPVIKKDNYGGRFIADEDQGRVSILGIVRLFFTNKVGPNGPALLTAGLDAISLVADPVLWPLCKSYCILLRFAWFPPYVERFAALTGAIADRFGEVTNHLVSTTSVGKIGRVFTAYGKCRLIAIPAYFIQVMFQPIHNMVFRYLKLLETDCTFDQSAGVDRISKEGGNNLRSYDLSAATDRLPLSVQVPVMALLGYAAGLTDRSWTAAKLWADIIRSIPFKLVTRTKKVRTLYYGTGHPMGTYSSWAVFSFTHHLLVQVCALWALLGYSSVGDALKAHEENGGRTQEDMSSDIAYSENPKPRSIASAMLSDENKSSFNKFGRFTSYQLLGDDIVLFTNTPFECKVAVIYFELMNLMGVSINPQKGVLSRNGSFEFAKRFVREGIHLNNIYWAEWTLDFSPMDAIAKIKLLLSRGYELPTLETIVFSIVGLLPVNIIQKRKIMESYSGLTNVKSVKPKQIYLVTLVLGALLYLYQIDLREWVTFTMGDKDLPRSVDQRESAPYPQSCLDNLTLLKKYVALLLQGISSKTYAFRIRLPILILRSITLSLCTLADVHKNDRPKHTLNVLEVLSHWTTALAYIIYHPAYILLRSYSVFSFKSILFAEVETMEKYRKSVSFEVHPFTPIEELVSKDAIDSKSNGVVMGCDRQYKELRVLGACLFAYWRYLAWFETDRVWEPWTLLNNIDELLFHTWLREVAISAAARLLIWYDQFTDQRKYNIEETLPSDEATPASFFGESVMKVKYELDLKTLKRQRLKVPKVYKFVGPWASITQCLEEPPEVEQFTSLRYREIEEFVVLLNIQEENKFPSCIYY